VAGEAFPWLRLVLLSLGGAFAATLANLPCRAVEWTEGVAFRRGCYTDIYPLYFRDGLDEGRLVYVDQPVEYPVLIGALMQAVARAVSGLGDPVARGAAYYDATTVVLSVCLAATVIAVGRIAWYGAGKRADGAVCASAALRAGAVVAFVPAGFLTAFINWDLLAVALSTGALAAWLRGRPWAAGALLGAAVAAKFYPVIFLGPLLVLALRDRWRSGRPEAPADALRLLGGAAACWGAVNLPVLVASPEGWATFFTFSRERGVDWGTGYHLLSEFGVRWAAGGDTLDLVAMGAFLAACLGIALLGLLARERPSEAALLFLVVAAFLLTNKVWSPQFVLWLIPLAVLAWPHRVPLWTAVAAFVIWQSAELGYVLGVWPYLAERMGREVETAVTVGIEGYAVLTLGRMCGLAVMCAVVCADCLRSGESTT
jgi:hypothetical protein